MNEVNESQLSNARTLWGYLHERGVKIDTEALIHIANNPTLWATLFPSEFRRDANGNITLRMKGTPYVICRANKEK